VTEYRPDGHSRYRRLSRSGTRRINRVLRIMAIVQLRNDIQAGVTTRALADGTSPREAIHSLKRRLSDV
jgi:hypothetical protein